MDAWVCLVFYLSRSVCSPFRAQTGQKCLHERDALPLLLKLNSQCSLLHPSVYCCKCRSLFYLSPQPKSPVSFAKILVQPPPQSSACEQQQARVHPWGDWQGQRVDGTGEHCSVFVLVHMELCVLYHWVIPFPALCLPLQDVSCNEIQVLPAQVGRLQALRELNIRKNCLHMLPEG